MKKILLKTLLFIIIVSLWIFGVKNSVFGVVKAEEVKDFNYIPKENYVLIENDEGSFKVDAKGNRYFHYNIIQQLGDTLEIIHKDDTIHTYTYEGNYDDTNWYKDLNGNRLRYVDSNNHYIEPKFSDNQKEVHWKVGTNNYATMEFLSIEKKIPVTIKESPIKSIKYVPANTCYDAVDAILDRKYQKVRRQIRS